jgi:DNA/RNA-binding domain of Phe-tRNA-synthetase-like protein
MIAATGQWKTEYPGALIGALAMRGVTNAGTSPRLDARRLQVESGLRAEFAARTREELRALPGLRPYVTYYKRFGKTYHVLLQLESLLFKGGSTTRATPLVEAMFLSEIKSQLLTAGHDLDAIQGRVTVDVSAGTETYVALGGGERTLKLKDMFVRDEVGILSSILYGPDDRTKLSGETGGVLFVVYGPPGVARDRLQAHLDDLAENVQAVAPGAVVVDQEILTAS